MGILTLLGGGILYLVQHFDGAPRALAYVFWPFLAVAVGGFTRASWMLIRAFHGYTYRRIPFPSQLQSYRRELEAALRAAGEPWLLDAKYREFLDNAHVEAADRNAVNNTNRGEYLYKANGAVVLTLVATALAGIPASIYSWTAPAHPQQVEVVSFPRRIVVDQKTQPAAQRPTIQLPKPPSNIDVRTGIVIPGKKP